MPPTCSPVGDALQGACQLRSVAVRSSTCAHLGRGSRYALVRGPRQQWRPDTGEYAKMQRGGRGEGA